MWRPPPGTANENLIVTHSDAVRAGLLTGRHTIAAAGEVNAGYRFSPAKVRWRRLTMTRMPSPGPDQVAPQTRLDKFLRRPGSWLAGSKCYHGEWVRPPAECVERGRRKPSQWDSVDTYLD